MFLLKNPHIFLFLLQILTTSSTCSNISKSKHDRLIRNETRVRRQEEDFYNSDYDEQPYNITLPEEKVVTEAADIEKLEDIRGQWKLIYVWFKTNVESDGCVTFTVNPHTDKDVQDMVKACPYSNFQWNKIKIKITSDEKLQSESLIAKVAENYYAINKCRVSRILITRLNKDVFTVRELDFPLIYMIAKEKLSTEQLDKLKNRVVEAKGLQGTVVC